MGAVASLTQRVEEGLLRFPQFFLPLSKADDNFHACFDQLASGLNTAIKLLHALFSAIHSFLGAVHALLGAIHAPVKTSLGLDEPGAKRV